MADTKEVEGKEEDEEDEGNLDYELLNVAQQQLLDDAPRGGYGTACRSQSLERAVASPIATATTLAAPMLFWRSFAEVHANRTRLNCYWLPGASGRRLPSAAARDLFTILSDSGARSYVHQNIVLFTRIPLDVQGAGLELLPACLTLATEHGCNVVTAALEYILAEVFVQDVYKLSLEFLTCFHPVVLAAEARLGRGSLFMLREVASPHRHFTDQELRYVYDLLPELRDAIGVFRG